MRAYLALSAFAAVTFMGGSQAFANGNTGPFAPGGGGPIYETSPYPADFIVHLTGKDGGYIDDQFPGWPKTLQGSRDGFGNYTAKVTAPLDARIHDAINETIPKLPAGGSAGGFQFRDGGVGGAPFASPRSVLYLESYGIDEDGLYVIEGMWGRVALDRPNLMTVIPDLYADTNETGDLDNEDILYGLVDMYTYVRNYPTLVNGGFGSSYVIHNGVCDELPGMYFSNVPFQFSPTTGFLGSSFSGRAVALTNHSIPEPTTLTTLAVPLLMLAGRRRRI